MASSVLSLDVSPCNITNTTAETMRTKRSLSIEDSDKQRLEVELNIAATEPECVNTTIHSKDEMVYHVVDSSTKPRPAKVLVQLTENATHSIDVYIGYGSKPNITHYNLKSSLRVPDNGNFSGSEYLVFVSADNVTNISTGLPLNLYVGLIATGRLSLCMLVVKFLLSLHEHE